MAEDADLLHRLGERSPIRANGPTGAPDSEFRAVRDRSADERNATAPRKR